MGEDKKPGWRSREMEKKYTKISEDFVDALHVKGFLKLRFDSSDARIEKILIRLSTTNQSFGKLYDLVSELEKFPPFAEAMKSFGFQQDDIMRIYTALSVHIILEEFEFLKTLMLMITEKKQYGTDKDGKPKAITGKETLGKLLNKYDEIVPKNQLHDVINNKFRNVVGHGKWWTSSQHFHFERDDGTIDKYDIPEFLLQTINLSTFLKCFYEKGFARAAKYKKKVPA